MKPFCVISIMQKGSLPQTRADYNMHVILMQLLSLKMYEKALKVSCLFASQQGQI